MARSRCTAALRRGRRAGSGSSGSISASGSAAGCRGYGSSTCAARPVIRSRRRCSPSSSKLAENGGKAILLLNRRGIAPALHCRAAALPCCPDCDVALVLHRDGSLRCHHCGHSEAAPEECPVCRSVDLARIGAGTQRLERELAAKVPELELIRLDADTPLGPGAARGGAAALSRGRSGRSCSGRRWSRRATTSLGLRSRPSWTRTRGSGCRTSAPRSAPPARDPARRTQRPRCAREGDRPELPARRAAPRASPRDTT